MVEESLRAENRSALKREVRNRTSTRECGELTFDRRNTHAVWGRVHKCHRVEARVGLALALATPVKHHPPPDAARDFGAPRAPTPRAEGCLTPTGYPCLDRCPIVNCVRCRFSFQDSSRLREGQERREILTGAYSEFETRMFGYSDIHHEVFIRSTRESKFV